MRRALCAIAVLLCACSQTYAVARLPADLAGERVRVRTAQGTVTATVVPTPTGTELRTLDNGVIERRMVISVVHDRTGRAAMLGLGWGLLTGAVLAGRFSKIGHDSEDGGHDNPAEDAIVIVGTLLGGATGMLLGAIVGGEDRYDMIPGQP